MINKVDIIFGVAWGDEGKGKICNRIAKDYDYVCRFNGGSNAGHTFYVNNQKVVTHLVPSGIVHNKKCIIGPNCVISPEKFYKEIDYLDDLGFDTSLIKISPKAHIVLDSHIEADNELKTSLGTTGQGIGPCYVDKVKRVGQQAKHHFKRKWLWNEELDGNILCEGAQSFWLDINQGNYPFVTTSECLPYAACSLGFSPKKIDKIIAVAKMYDTRAGKDPFFETPEDMNEELKLIAKLGNEFGSTTGRPRSIGYLNLDNLVYALEKSGATEIIFNKGDILEQAGVFKLYYNFELHEFVNIEEMKTFIKNTIMYDSNDFYPEKTLAIRDRVNFDFAP